MTHPYSLGWKRPARQGGLRALDSAVLTHLTLVAGTVTIVTSNDHPRGFDVVLAQRLATQRLTGPATDPATVVRELLCVQAQDAPLSRYSIALRTAGTEAAVRKAIDSGEIVRTHILRPTWHYVAAEDLRWILQLTSAKVESGMAARHRQLGLDEPLIAASMDALRQRLRHGEFATRKELATWLVDQRLFQPSSPLFGQQVGHTLMLAELRGLICSGPLKENEHSYALVEEIIPAARAKDREEAVTELVFRFFASHGPVAVRDLVRWTRLTQTEIKRAIAQLDDRVEIIEMNGDTLWFAPEALKEPVRVRRAFLLSVFDEAFLSYRHAGFPALDEHPSADMPNRFTEAGGGPVICDLRDVGTWKRTIRKGAVDITLTVARSLDAEQRNEIGHAAYRLADIVGGVARITVDLPR